MKPFVLFSSLPINVLVILIIAACALALICIAIYIAIACYLLQELWELEIEETSNSDESKVENGLQREKMKEIVVKGFQCFTGDETKNQPDSEDSKAQWKSEETSTDSETFWEVRGQTVSENLPVDSERHSKEELDEVVKQQGKTLMEEEPYAAAIDNKYLALTCSKCFTCRTFCNYRNDFHSCEHCEVIFYCSKECQKEDWEDHKAECEYFRINRSFFIPCAEVRLAARMIRKSVAKPEWKAFNGRTYDSLMDHADKHRTDKEYMALIEEDFWEFRIFLGPDAPDFETFFQARCKMDINGFGIRVYTPKEEFRGTAVYLGLSVHDHSCRPDAFVVSDGSKLLLRTTKTSLLYSDKVMISYRPYTYLNGEERRETLLNQYFFVCECTYCTNKDLGHSLFPNYTTCTAYSMLINGTALISDLHTNRSAATTTRRERDESGRPSCCPNGWFSFSKLRCSICFMPTYNDYWNAFEANESLKAFLKSDKCKSGFDDPDIHDSCYSRSEDTVMSMMKDFQTYQKLLSDDNVYLRKFAKLIYNHSEERYKSLSGDYSENDMKIKNGQVYYSMMSKQPYTFDFLYFLYDWGLYHKMDKMFLPLEAVEKAIDMGEVLCGENHYLTQFLKKKIPKLSEL